MRKRKLYILAGLILIALTSGNPVWANDIPPSANSGQISLELQNMNILEVLKLLSKKSGLNIVAGKNVQGQVSIFLQDVPVKAALKTILESQNLASIEDHGIIKIMTEQDYLQKQGRPYADKKVTKIYALKYAGAMKILAQLNQLKTPQGRIVVNEETNTLHVTELPEVLREIELMIEKADRAQETKIFHLKYINPAEVEMILDDFFKESSGKFSIDERSNQLLVTDTKDRIASFSDMMKEIDIPIPQVLIEAKIIEVKLNDNYRQGINWQEIFFALKETNVFTTAIPLTVSPPTGVSTLPAMTIGEDGDDLRAVIQLLETIGKTNLLSSPRLTALSNEEASLAVATRQPFVSQTVVQTTNSTNTADNVQFVDVGVTLKVLPRISHDNFIHLKIAPEISSSTETLDLEGVAQGSNTTFTRTSIPVVTTQELETTVFVKSGTTIILGGLIQDSQSKSSSKVPILGSIPFLGRAFQSKTHDFSKTELVIFLTPTILAPDVETQEKKKYVVEGENQIRKFNEFANYPYRLTYFDIKRHIDFGERPYWETLKGCKSAFCHTEK